MTLTPSQPRRSQVKGNSRDHKTKNDSLEVPQEDWMGGRGGKSDANISLYALWPVPAYRSVLHSDLFLRIVQCYILTCSCISFSATFWPVPAYCFVLHADQFLRIVPCYILTSPVLEYHSALHSDLFLRIVHCYILTRSCISFNATFWPELAEVKRETF